MTVKSLRKQLAAAIAMTLVASVALGSSTYAWFVNNAQVTATNVNVQASTAYSLLISSNETPTVWGTTTELANTLTKLTPVSTIGEVWVGENNAALELSKADGDDPAVGIGDDTSVETGDVRFVTSTGWTGNYVTDVREVSKTSVIREDSDETYFYTDSVNLKSAQAGKIYLDSTGTGIMWLDATDEDATAPELYAFADFLDLDGFADDTEDADEIAYNERLSSAQALLRTLRVGMLVTKTGTDNAKTRVWHEYALAGSSDYISDGKVDTTLNADTNVNGISNAVTASDGTPVPGSFPGSVKDMTSPIDAYMAIGSETSLATDYSSADVIAEVAVNEVINVDIYVWMEGCDYDTVAAHIADFSGTGVRAMQFGFCLGAN